MKRPKKDLVVKNRSIERKNMNLLGYGEFRVTESSPSRDVKDPFACMAVVLRGKVWAEGKKIELSVSWELRGAIILKESRVRRRPTAKSLEPLTFKISGREREWKIRENRKKNA